MENVLDDFTQDVSNGLLDLLVDLILNILLGVVDVAGLLLVSTLLELVATPGVAIERKSIIGIDRVASASINVMSTLTFLCTTAS